MTVRHYLNSDNLTMQSTVLSSSENAEGLFEVILSDTLFHPQGGGQPSDMGMIGKAKVLQVSVIGEKLVHLCDSALAEGNVSITVLPGPRSLHTKLHSAGHLIGHCVEQFGWKAVRGHHWPDEARVICDAGINSRQVLPEVVETLVQAYIASDLSRNINYSAGRRMIGFGNLPDSPCGGTHVPSCSTVGAIKILKIKEKLGQLWIHYDLTNILALNAAV